MNNAQLMEIKEHLANELRVLESYEFDMTEQACADENEYASLVADALVKAAMRARTAESIREIQQALKRVERRDYGRCEDCGGLIGAARLKARPSAGLCVECQSAREERSSRLGAA